MNLLLGWQPVGRRGGLCSGSKNKGPQRGLADCYFEPEYLKLFWKTSQRKRSEPAGEEGVQAKRRRGCASRSGAGTGSTALDLCVLG